MITSDRIYLFIYLFANNDLILTLAYIIQLSIDKNTIIIQLGFSEIKMKLYKNCILLNCV